MYGCCRWLWRVQRGATSLAYWGIFSVACNAATVPRDALWPRSAWRLFRRLPTIACCVCNVSALASKKHLFLTMTRLPSGLQPWPSAVMKTRPLRFSSEKPGLAGLLSPPTGRVAGPRRNPEQPINLRLASATLSPTYPNTL